MFKAEIKLAALQKCKKLWGDAIQRILQIIYQI